MTIKVIKNYDVTGLNKSGRVFGVGKNKPCSEDYNI